MTFPDHSRSRPPRPRSSLAHAFDRWEEIERRLDGRRTALFFDFDGTLAPIVNDPDDVAMPEETRQAIENLRQSHSVAIISGRSLASLADQVPVANVWLAGSHGFEILGPQGQRFEIPDADAAKESLDRAEPDLRSVVADRSGVELERKPFAMAVHYRRAEGIDEESLEKAIDDVGRTYGLRVSAGRKVIDVTPDVDWDKGRAVWLLADRFDLATDGDAIIYIGDDTTDENAFRSLRSDDLGIVVRERPDEQRMTAADYALDDPSEVVELMHRL